MQNTYNIQPGTTFNYGGQFQIVTKVAENEIVFTSARRRTDSLSFAHFAVSVSYYGFITDIKNPH